MNCAQFRELASEALDRDRALGPSAERHARTCQACKSYRIALLGMAHRLQAEAATLGTDYPPYLRQRVMAEVRDIKSPSRPSRWWLSGVEWGVVLAAVLGVGLLLAGTLGRGTERAPVMQTDPGLPLAVAAVKVSRDVQQTVNALYTTEAESLKSDVEGAISFLLDCIPGHPTPSKSDS